MSLIDSSAGRERKEREEKAPQFDTQHEVNQYNHNQDIYSRELSIAPVYATLRKKKVRKPKVPGHPVVIPPPNNNTAAAKARRKKEDKEIAYFRTLPPAARVPTLAERTNAKRLEDKDPGVNKLTYCAHQKKKTPNKNSSVVTVLIKGHPRYRLKSNCTECGSRKSTLLKGSDPDNISGGELI